MALINNMTGLTEGRVCIKINLLYTTYDSINTGCTCYSALSEKNENIITGEEVLIYRNINPNIIINTGDSSVCLVIQDFDSWIESYINSIASSGYTGSTVGIESRYILDSNDGVYYKVEHNDSTCSIDNLERYAIMNTVLDKVWLSGDTQTYFYDEFDNCGKQTGYRYVRISDINPYSKTYQDVLDIQKCKNETEPIVSDTTVTDITINSAKFTGEITNDGGFDIVDRGFVYSRNRIPTVNDSKISINGTTGQIVKDVTGLSEGAFYYVNTFAENLIGTSYGQYTTFSTVGLGNFSLSTSGPIKTSGSTVYFDSSYSNPNNITVLSYGVCWNTSGTPTIKDNNTSTIYTLQSTFRDNIDGLVYGQVYYFRVYIKTKYFGEIYSPQYSITAGSTPIVSTTYISLQNDITRTSAVVKCGLNGQGLNGIISEGYPVSLNECGFCWSTNPTPTTNNSKLIVNQPYSGFTTNITGLTANNQYYVRAYAINSYNTGYSNQLSFATKPYQVPTLNTTTVQAKTQTTIDVTSSVSDNGGYNIGEYGFCWHEGFIEDMSVINSPHASVGTGINVGVDYNYQIINLTQNTEYYIRSYAVNDAGYGYGDVIQVTTKGGTTLFVTTNNPAISVHVYADSYDTTKTGTNLEFNDIPTNVLIVIDSYGPEGYYGGSYVASDDTTPTGFQSFDPFSSGLDYVIVEANTGPTPLEEYYVTINGDFTP